MGEKKEPAVKQTLGKNSQVARLDKIIKQTRFSLILGVVLLALLIVAIVGFVNATQKQLEISMALNQYRLGSKTLTAAVQSYAATGDMQYYEAYMQELNVDKNRDAAWKTLQENDIKDDEWAALNEIAGLSNGLVPLEEDAMAAVAEGNNQAAMNDVFGSEYAETAQRISSLTDDTINKILERLETKKTRFLIVEIICMVAFVAAFIRLAHDSSRTIKFSQKELLVPIIKVAGQMTALADGNLHTALDLEEDDSEVGHMVSSIEFMKNNLTGIIGEISYVLEQMGQGNYRVNIEQNYVGEYVQIKESLNRIIEEMRKTVGTIVRVSEDIDGGAGQLETAAEDLANACTSQASDVSDLMTLLEDLSNAIDYNTKEAEEAVNISNRASSTLVANNQKMEELRAAMNNINECSEQIVAVISTISDIGNEINMLSLNASIESARAGEAGRGFSVVAEQVKKLAEESQNAAAQTADMIKRTVEAVEVGVRIASETAETMEEMRVGVEETNSRINRVVDKLRGEVDSIANINGNINNIAGMVDNNSATSEETAAVSGEQKRQVESLIEYMERFKI